MLERGTMILDEGFYQYGPRYNRKRNWLDWARRNKKRILARSLGLGAGLVAGHYAHKLDYGDKPKKSGDYMKMAVWGLAGAKMGDHTYSRMSGKEWYEDSDY